MALPLPAFVVGVVVVTFLDSATARWVDGEVGERVKIAMDSDQGKLFIGGISWETDEEKLKEYFQGYGEVVQAVVMRDKISGKPRGFGFVVFADPDILDTVLQDRHVIDGRTGYWFFLNCFILAPVLPFPGVKSLLFVVRIFLHNHIMVFIFPYRLRLKELYQEKNNRFQELEILVVQETLEVVEVPGPRRYLGGLPPTLSEDGFRQYFEAYGMVTDVVIMYDQQTNRPRGFGFISFDSEDAVDRVLHKTFHDLNGKQVEVKRALPKDANPGGGGRSMGGGSSGGYQGYGSSMGNSSSYDGRMESNKYLQSQHASGGYPSYGSSGYNAPGYGYGPTNNGMGYGYGNYGAPAGGGYGNPNGPNAGYGGPANAQRSPWGSQAPSGYGYGSSQWGTTSGGSSATGQPQTGASGYGNQGYGYGGYGGHDGTYGNQAAYGAVGGRAGSGPNGSSSVGDLQGGSGGYMGGGYGDGSGNYGGGYGATSTR
ncbi:UNVERIFIED_CONTAM: Heterogeneous nuclear ribonucleoprotein 1 [Sesamum calycinum]|uniref:Heterogeneous nuclear ribonucleoprotein 1 n=1 Tax=Sesamum calycinum TaxID=2727403 RepID=A0AAW2IRZ9_9LAMI